MTDQQSTANASSSDQKTLTLVCHFGGIVLGFIPSLVIYLVKSDDTHLREHAKRALNFQLAVLVAAVAVSVISGILPFASFLFPVVWIGNIVLCVIAGMKANQGEMYEYPVSIPLVK